MKSIGKKFIEDTHNITLLYKENDVLFNICHPFLISGLCSFQTEQKILRVLDYVAGENLHDHICEYGQIDETSACLYAAEIVLGIGYLHEHGYI